MLDGSGEERTFLATDKVGVVMDHPDAYDVMVKSVHFEVETESENVIVVEVYREDRPTLVQEFPVSLKFTFVARSSYNLSYLEQGLQLIEMPFNC